MDSTKNKALRIVSRLLLLVAITVIIIQLFPNDKKFKYTYEIGKPWNYELLTASFDFPIYKTDEQLQKDKEELLRNYSPYFQKNEEIYLTQYNKWLDAWKSKNDKLPRYLWYVQGKLQEIYKKGVISSSDYDKMIKLEQDKISLVNKNREVSLIALDDLYTPKKIYEDIIANKPFSLSSEELNSYNINQFFTNNLTYDSIMSEKVKEDKVKNLSKTEGLVQTGEKIIDKGELITSEDYAVLNSLKIEMENRTSTSRETLFVIFGETILVLGLLLILFAYFYHFRPLIYENFKYLLFFSLLSVMMVTLAALVLKFTRFSVAIVPLAILPIIVRVFFDSRTALFTHIITVFLCAFIVNNPFSFVFFQIVAGMVAVSGLKDITARGQLAQISLYVFVSYLISYIGFTLIFEGSISIQSIDYFEIFCYAISSLLLLFSYVLIYLFEKLFGLVSSLTLVELTNINSDFMLKFAEVAPGSFQHSLQVSNLAAEAAKKINANSLLVRTGALYHDIGKMKHPEYFIENQGGGENPLLKMSYENASQAIINHVLDGVEMAKKYRLPEQIIAFIVTHHGKSQTTYFYNSFVNENKGIEPDIQKFTYPGPLPYTKEMTILMMADAVEARSRTLEEYTEESIRLMVEDMVDKQIASGQFKDAPISFKDVEIVKEVLAEKVQNIYHGRIKYPGLEKDKKNA